MDQFNLPRELGDKFQHIPGLVEAIVSPTRPQDSAHKPSGFSPQSLRIQPTSPQDSAHKPAGFSPQANRIQPTSQQDSAHKPTGFSPQAHRIQPTSPQDSAHKPTGFSSQRPGPNVCPTFHSPFHSTFHSTFLPPSFPPSVCDSSDRRVTLHFKCLQMSVRCSVSPATVVTATCTK